MVDDQTPVPPAEPVTSEPSVVPSPEPIPTSPLETPTEQPAPVSEPIEPQIPQPPPIPPEPEPLRPESPNLADPAPAPVEQAPVTVSEPVTPVVESTPAPEPIPAAPEPVPEVPEPSPQPTPPPLPLPAEAEAKGGPEPRMSTEELLASRRNDLQEKINEALKAEQDQRRILANQARIDQKKDRLNEIISFAQSHGPVTNQDVRDLLHISQSTATDYLSELVNRGMLKKEGKSNITTYQ